MVFFKSWKQKTRKKREFLENGKINQLKIHFFENDQKRKKYTTKKGNNTKKTKEKKTSFWKSEKIKKTEPLKKCKKMKKKGPFQKNQKN